MTIIINIDHSSLYLGTNMAHAPKIEPPVRIPPATINRALLYNTVSTISKELQFSSNYSPDDDSSNSYYLLYKAYTLNSIFTTMCTTMCTTIPCCTLSAEAHLHTFYN